MVLSMWMTMGDVTVKLTPVEWATVPPAIAALRIQPRLAAVGDEGVVVLGGMAIAS